MGFRDFDIRMFIYRIVSLNMNASISSEVEILCKQTGCSLIKPTRIAVMKDKMYVIRSAHKNISVFEGISENLLLKIQKKICMYSFCICVWSEMVIPIVSKFMALIKCASTKPIIKLI